MESVLSNPVTQEILPDGRVVDKIALTSDASMYIGQSGEIVSIEEGGIKSTGTFVWTEESGISLKNGTVEGNMETGYSIKADVDNGKTYNIEIKDKDGNQAVKIDPERPGDNIKINSVFNPAISEFTFTIANALLYFANSYTAKINNDTVESITQKVNAISAGSLFNDTNKFLYALANGIRNPSIDPNTPPAYIFNLEQDIQNHSNDTVSAVDIFPIALYQGMVSSTTTNGAMDTVNGAIDAVKWLIESQTVYSKSLVTKVQTDMTKYFAGHVADWNRPVVGMGYSGGFIPLIEGVSSLMYNVKTIVGLGGPSAYLKSETLQVIITALKAVSDGALGTVQNVLKALGCEDSFIGNFISAAQVSSDAIYPFIKDIYQRYGSLETFNFSPQKTDLIVNVWGTEDIFHKLGVVDARTNFLGKTTYNIEIVGAGHTDYIRGTDPNNPNPVWNNTVANFVTDLMLASKDENQLRQFFDRNADKIYLDTARGVYVVRLQGSGV